MYHKPVMLKEVIEYLRVEPNKNYIDCTFGFGGHSKVILQKNSPLGKVLGIEQNLPTLKMVKEEFAKEINQARLIIAPGNFRRLQTLVERFEFARISGILFDIGVSSYQLDEAGIGLSFKRDEPLDMRLSKSESELTGVEIVNTWPVEEMIQIFKEYGQERYSKHIARAIINYRLKKEIKTSLQLAQLIEKAIARRNWPPRIHPATRIFQAIRIAVNSELEALESGLNQAVDLIDCGGRIVVISFHSLEDKIVKNIFRNETKDCLCPKEFPQCVCGHKKRLKIITKKPLKPTPEEIEKNPRARSALLRVAEKI